MPPRLSPPDWASPLLLSLLMVLGACAADDDTESMMSGGGVDPDGALADMGADMGADRSPPDA